MEIKISGQNMQVGDSLKSHVEELLIDKVKKYFSSPISADVIFVKEGKFFKVNIVLNEGVKKGVMIRGNATCDEPYSAFDKSAHRIAKQLRRYHSRITDHNIAIRHHKDEDIIEGKKYILSDDGQDFAEDNAIIIAEKQANIDILTVSEAVMQMNLAHLPALMFVDKKSGNISVVYHREDGNVSWVDSGKNIVQIIEKKEFSHEIKGERIALKKHEVSFAKAEEIFALVDKNRQYLSKWLGWVDGSQKAEDSFAFLLYADECWKSYKEMIYGVYLGKDLIGSVSCFNMDYDNASGEIGYWMSEDVSGNGYMSEAVELLENELFDNGFNRITIGCDDKNISSQKVAEKCGYKLDGIMRQDRVIKEGIYKNSRIYSKLKSES